MNQYIQGDALFKPSAARSVIFIIERNTNIMKISFAKNKNAWLPVLLSLVLLAICVPAFGRQGSQKGKAIDGPEMKVFDFMIGQWETAEKQMKDGKEVVLSTSDINNDLHDVGLHYTKGTTG